MDPGRSQGYKAFTGEVVPKAVFLSNVSVNTDHQDLKDYFEQFYGPVVDIRIFKRGDSIKVTARVDFKEMDDAKRVLSSPDHRIGGRDVKAVPFQLGEDVAQQPAARTDDLPAQIFLYGIPEHLTQQQLIDEVRGCGVNVVKLDVNKNCGYLRLHNDSDVAKLMARGTITIGTRRVDVKKYEPKK